MLDPFKVIKQENVHYIHDGKVRELNYTSSRIVGSGSFGVVFQTRLIDTNEDAVIKRVLQDKRFKVRIITVRIMFTYFSYRIVNFKLCV